MTVTDQRMRIGDVAELLGIKLRSAYQYRSHGRLPLADGTDDDGDFWLRSTMDEFVAARPGAGRRTDLGYTLPPRQIEIGSKVAVTKGALAGRVGMVKRITDGQCLVRFPGSPQAGPDNWGGTGWASLSQLELVEED